MYTGSLTINSPKGTITREQSVPVRGALVDFWASPPTMDLGAPVTLTRIVSPDLANLKYTWNFGDGSAEIEDARSLVIHSFPEAAPAVSYTVRLTITHASGTAVHAESVRPRGWALFLPLSMRSVMTEP